MENIDKDRCSSHEVSNKKQMDVSILQMFDTICLILFGHKNFR